MIRLYVITGGGVVLQNEEKIIAGAKNGNKEDFEQIVLHYQNKIYTLCYRYVNNSEDARDLAQEVFIKAYRNIKNFEGRSSLSTWLYQIANNTCKDYLRKIKNKSEFSIDEELFTEESAFVPDVLKDEHTPDRAYEDKEKLRLLREAMQTMSVEYKMVLILREFQDLSYEEIARLTDTTVGTVKSRLSRGRSALKKIFADKMEGGLYEKVEL